LHCRNITEFKSILKFFKNSTSWTLNFYLVIINNTVRALRQDYYPKMSLYWNNTTKFANDIIKKYKQEIKNRFKIDLKDSDIKIVIDWM